MKVQYHETEGSKSTMLFDPSFEVDKVSGRVRIHATEIWHNGVQFSMPDHRGSIHKELWFDPHSGEYVSGKANEPGSIQLCWVKDSVFHVLRYKPQAAKRLRDKVMFWRNR